MRTNGTHMLPMRKLILNMPFGVIPLCIPKVYCAAASTIMDICSGAESRHLFPARDNTSFHVSCSNVAFAETKI